MLLYDSEKSLRLNLNESHIVWDSFREGNRDALEYIYENNYSALFYYGLKFTPDKNLVKDIIHELFVELIDSGKKLGHTDNIRYYLLKALRYKLLKYKSDAKKIIEKRKYISEFNLLESVENQLIKNEIEENIRNTIVSAVKKLSEKQQEVIYLRFYNNMPYVEIAQIFGVKVQTVRNLMNRAIQSLKNDFQNKGISRNLILMILQLPL